LTASDTRRGQLLFDFRGLDDSVGARLERALAELPETHANGLEGRQAFDAAMLDRRKCVSEILAAVSKDYAANKQKEMLAGWTFEYVVELSAGTTLSVMARLFGKIPDSKGSVFYGADIVRVGPDSYAVWSDFD
jgi:hypothetical protein